MRRLLAPAAALGLAGCLGMTGSAPPEGLAYGIPDPNPATYTFVDTTVFTVAAAGVEAVEVRTTQEGTAELQFRRAPAGLRVDVRFPRYLGTFENPSQGTSRADEDDVGGPLTVALAYRGRVEVVDTPSLSPTLLAMAGPESLVRPFFVRLPGRTVARGARWVDTVTTREESAGTVSRSTSVITSELMGDTLADGRTLLRIHTTAESEIVVTGVSGGVEVEERLDGRVQGVVLWDDASRLLVERVEEGTLRGTLAMPETGVAPLPVSATTRRRVVLRP